MGCYICPLCDKMYDSHEVNCFEYGDNELICEGCQERLDGEEDMNRAETLPPIIVVAREFESIG